MYLIVDEYSDRFIAANTLEGAADQVAKLLGIPEVTLNLILEGFEVEEDPYLLILDIGEPID